ATLTQDFLHPVAADALRHGIGRRGIRCWRLVRARLDQVFRFAHGRKTSGQFRFDLLDPGSYQGPGAVAIVRSARPRACDRGRLNPVRKVPAKRITPWRPTPVDVAGPTRLRFGARRGPGSTGLFAPEPTCSAPATQGDQP